MVLSSPNKYINNLYYFFMCVDGGDFDFGEINNLLNCTNAELLPSLAVFLDKGVVGYAKEDQQKGFQFHKYPNEVNRAEYDWFFAKAFDANKSTPEGAHLALLYGQLINHLSTSRLEPPNAYPYTSAMSVFRKSSLKWAKGDS